MNLKKNKEITIDSLAIMVNKGFEAVKLDISELKGGVNELKDEVNEFKFDINERLDSIENILLGFKPRIERTEEQIKDLQSDYRQLLGMKKHI